MTLTLYRQSTLERPAPELMKAPRLTEPAARRPNRRRWLAAIGLVAVIAVGGLVLNQQRDDPEQASSEYSADTYGPSGALHAPGVLDGVFVIPEAPTPGDTYTPQRVLAHQVLDGAFVIPEAPVLADTYTAPGMRPTAGMLDGVYDAADPPQLPMAPDIYSGQRLQPGLPDGEWVRPQASSIYPCRISGPC